MPFQYVRSVLKLDEGGKVLEFPDAVVVVTPNFMGILPEGSIGLKFFKEHPSILDFDKKRMYVK